MTIRSNPECFRDVFSSVTNKSHKRANKKQTVKDSKKKDDNHDSIDEEEQGDQATASGYIRSIAARLILIDHINTTKSYYPALRNMDCFETHPSSSEHDDKMNIEEDEEGEDDNSSKERRAQCNMKKIEVEEVNVPTKSEIEFSLKSFVRAGRYVPDRLVMK